MFFVDGDVLMNLRTADNFKTMPALIGVNEFVDETRDDFNSPTTSTFVSRMAQCRHTITTLEEVRLDARCSSTNDAMIFFRARSADFIQAEYYYVGVFLIGCSTYV